jgi:hypothetical protein
MALHKDFPNRSNTQYLILKSGGFPVDEDLRDTEKRQKRFYRQLVDDLRKKKVKRMEGI